MAQVYQAYDHRLKVWRAVKILLPEYVKRKKIRQRFLTEAQAMAFISDLAEKAARVLQSRGRSLQAREAALRGLLREGFALELISSRGIRQGTKRSLDAF